MLLTLPTKAVMQQMFVTKLINKPGTSVLPRPTGKDEQTYKMLPRQVSPNNSPEKIATVTGVLET